MTGGIRHTSSDLLVPGRWLLPVRAAWLVLAIGLIAVRIAANDAYIDELSTVCKGETCSELAPTAQDAAEMASRGISLKAYATYQAGFDFAFFLISIPLAALVFWRRSDTWIGIIVSLTLVFLNTISSQAATALVGRYPRLELPHTMLDGMTVLLFISLLYTFPNGRSVPGWARFSLLGLAAAFVADPFLPSWIPRIDSTTVPLVSFALLCLVGGIPAQVYRYRVVSTRIQRQQTKWSMFGLITAASVFLLWTVIVEILNVPTGTARLIVLFGSNILGVLFMLLPISLVFSILRYRLWDIDLIIRRTLVYGLVMTLLGTIYVGSITLLQSGVVRMMGSSSPVVLVVSTLATVALFAPLRRRVQGFVDRRFNRRHYDATRTLQDFGDIARDEVDLEKLEAALLGVVGQTMEPRHASLWVNEPAGTSRPARES